MINFDCKDLKNAVSVHQRKKSIMVSKKVLSSQVIFNIIMIKSSGY